MSAIILLLVIVVGVSECERTISHLASSASYTSFPTPATSLGTSLTGPQSATSTSSSLEEETFAAPEDASFGSKPTELGTNRGISDLTLSSWSLTKEYVEQMLHIMKNYDLLPLKEVAGNDTRAVLTSGEYQGKTALVYKLAPGTIVAGVRRNHDEEIERQITEKHFDIYDNDYAASHEDIDISPHKVGNDEIFRSAIAPGPTQSWEIHYLNAPPSLSSRDKPHLLHSSTRTIPEHLRGPINTAAAAGADVVLTPVGVAVKASRSKVRGTWLSFLLLHYMGFIPQLPGLPRHIDPFLVAPSIHNTPARQVPHDDSRSHIQQIEH